MKKQAVICSLLALFVVPAMAPLVAQDQPPTDQNQTPPAQTEPVKLKKTRITPRFEISAGYAYRKYYAPDGPAVGVPGNVGMNGWYVSFNDNLKRWIGIAGEVVDTGTNQGFLLGDTHIYTFVAGPQIYPLGHRKLSPFGHFLYGGGYYHDNIPPFQEFAGNTITSLVRVWEGGGGLDMNLSQHWGVRLIEIDVGSANFFPSTSTFTNSTMPRVSVGVVYRFGQR